MLIGPSFILEQEEPIGKSIYFLGFNKDGMKKIGDGEGLKRS
jgi:hypothetical protein